MSSFDTFEGFRDWLLGVLAAAVLGLLGLVRKLDVGEINRRLDKLEGRQAAGEEHLGEVLRRLERLAAETPEEGRKRRGGEG